MKKLKAFALMPLLFFLIGCGAVTSVPSPTATPTITQTLAPTATPVASWPGLHNGWMTFDDAPFIYISMVVYNSQGYLWANTTDGLSRWNIETGLSNHYTEADGLPKSFWPPIYHDGNWDYTRGFYDGRPFMSIWGKRLVLPGWAKLENIRINARTI